MQKIFFKVAQNFSENQQYSIKLMADFSVSSSIVMYLNIINPGEKACKKWKENNNNEVVFPC